MSHHRISRRTFTRAAVTAAALTGVAGVAQAQPRANTAYLMTYFTESPQMVGADYGLTVVTRASPQAYQFAMFILSLNGQRTLARYGFAAPLLPP